MSAPYPTRLDLCDGKYTVIFDLHTGQAECLRYGEKWRSLLGDKMVLALFDELVAAREQRDRLLSVLKMFAELDACDGQRDRLAEFDAKHGVGDKGRYSFFFGAVRTAIAEVEGSGHEPV